MKHDERKCPACAEPVKIEALVCKHCGKQFDPEDVRRAVAAQKRTSMIGGGILLAILLVAVVTCSGEDKPDPKAAAEAAAKTAEDRRKGMHCLSAWDGSNRSFVNEVKSQLRDPDSFEHESTRIAPVENGKHAVIMEYRAKNGFGGFNRAVAIGEVDAADCSATVGSVDFKPM